MKPEGQLSAKIKSIPEIEDIDVSSMETEDYLSAFEIVEEAKLIEEVEKSATDTTDKVLGTTITEENKDEEHFPRTSRVGRVIRRPNRLVETNTAAVNAEDVIGYLQMIREVNENEFEKEEFCAVGAGIEGGFTHTTELKVLKFDEAANGPDKENWYKHIEEEYERFAKMTASRRYQSKK